MIPSTVKKWRKEAIFEEIRSEFDVEGIEDIISELEVVKNDGSYLKLANSYKIVQKDHNFILGISLPSFAKRENLLIKIAHETLNNPIISTPFSDMIRYADFTWLYLFMEVIYAANVDRELEYKDLRNIYLSGLDVRIIFALENFDTALQIPEPSFEFFQKLKKTRYGNNEVKKFFRKISMIKRFIIHDVLGYFPFSKFQITEFLFILLLSGCSAVNNGREKINEADIVRANMTYFKLIRTDITQYKAPGMPEVEEYGLNNNKSRVFKEDDGYLLCDHCFGFYHLQLGESPEDFDTCQCGGKLKYYKNLYELENELISQKIDL